MIDSSYCITNMLDSKINYFNSVKYTYRPSSLRTVTSNVIILIYYCAMVYMSFISKCFTYIYIIVFSISAIPA